MFCCSFCRPYPLPCCPKLYPGVRGGHAGAAPARGADVRQGFSRAKYGIDTVALPGDSSQNGNGGLVRSCLRQKFRPVCQDLQKRPCHSNVFVQLEGWGCFFFFVADLPPSETETFSCVVAHYRAPPARGGMYCSQRQEASLVILSHLKIFFFFLGDARYHNILGTDEHRDIYQLSY